MTNASQEEISEILEDAVEAKEIDQELAHMISTLRREAQEWKERHESVHRRYVDAEQKVVKLQAKIDVYQDVMDKLIEELKRD